ncbi:hypothetical protein PR048_014607 [Dryococelus australis]|uniref:Uncharacterized protein n=1 Tax=Dryococelus australis TaxID=614101 RepID=A0ABQ9HEQ0_9NEOP|nr:hypothetical protein PR048_014607 [Dryococelus australis]
MLLASGLFVQSRQIFERSSSQGYFLRRCAKFSSSTKANRVRFRQGRSRFFACRNRSGRCCWSAGFRRDLQIPPPLHSGAAPYSPRFTLIGSQYLDTRVTQTFPLHYSVIQPYIAANFTVSTPVGTSYKLSVVDRNFFSKFEFKSSELTANHLSIECEIKKMAVTPLYASACLISTIVASSLRTDIMPNADSVDVCVRMYNENTRRCDIALIACVYSNHRDSAASKWKKTAVVNKMTGRRGPYYALRLAKAMWCSDPSMQDYSLTDGLRDVAGKEPASDWPRHDEVGQLIGNTVGGSDWVLIRTNMLKGARQFSLQLAHVEYVHVARQEHCTSVQSYVLRGDDALDARGSVDPIARPQTRVRAPDRREPSFRAVFSRLD